MVSINRPPLTGFGESLERTAGSLGKNACKVQQGRAHSACVAKLAYVFDSQNIAFWSTTEQCYLMFFRVYQDKKRRIARAESHDFIQWSKVVLMDYRGEDGEPAVIEELYTNQT
jgi:hypothetical protein